MNTFMLIALVCLNTPSNFDDCHQFIADFDLSHNDCMDGIYYFKDGVLFTRIYSLA